jgi:hypothetical protein
MQSDSTAIPPCPYCKIAELEAERDKLREGLQDAIDGYEEYSQYAGDYLCKKHGVAEEIAILRALQEGEQHVLVPPPTSEDFPTPKRRRSAARQEGE